MKHKNQSRAEKISFLLKLQSGKVSIKDLLPTRTELWYQLDHEPNKFINEITDEVITTEEMKLRDQKKGNNILFITIYNFENK